MKKFNQGDIFVNKVRTYPKSKFLVNSGSLNSVYYNKHVASVSSSIGNGYIGLNNIINNVEIIDEVTPGANPYSNGNQSYNDLYAALVDISTYDAQAPTAGGTLSLNGVSLGSYDLTIIEGDVNISSGWSVTDYFTNTQDSRSALLVIKGNLTVDVGEVFTPSVRKLFLGIYCTGNAVINGEVSMTGRGANHSSATGSNTAAGAIRLYTGTGLSTTNPEVPAAGGTGGTGSSSSTGAVGSAGTGGGTGGGGAGGGAAGANSGSGAAGTSYTGGTSGGGGISGVAGTSGAIDGGPGGDGGCGDSTADRGAAGGSGNPGGQGDSYLNLTDVDGNSGTAGVLAIFVDGALSGSGSVTSDGTDGGDDDGAGVRRDGGGTGGGSVNVMCGSGSIGTLTANGGSGNDSGGAGGAGTARQSTGL